MGSPGSTPDVTRQDIRRVFSQLDKPSKPITTTEVAERLECTLQRAQHSLKELVELGELQTRKINDTTHVWWRVEDKTPDSEQKEFSDFVSAVENYAIFMLDPSGNVISWNEGAELIKGYTEDEIIGDHFSKFYTDNDIDNKIPEQNLEIAVEEGRAEDEGWRVRKDGSRFWAKVTITAVRDDDGTLQGFTKVTRDMTEQREYEQQLRQERDLTKQVFETVPVSICVVTSDGEFSRANQRILDRIGIEEQELTDYSAESWEIYDVDGEPIPVEEWPWKKALNTGEPVHDFQCIVDLPNIGRRWLSLNAAPIKDYQDDERVVLSIDDITDQKEYEQELRREYNQTEKLLRTAPIAIAVHDAEGNVIMANQRAQDALGLSEQELIEKPEDAEAWEIYDGEGNLLSPTETPSARVLSTGEPVFDEELIFDPPSGERMHFSVNTAPIFGPDGTIERVITAGEDITELKKRERQLEQRKSELETELSEILGRISDAFYALDDEWRFTHLNEKAAEIMQHSRDELIDQKVWKVFPDAVEGVFWEEFQTAMETQESVSFEFYAENIDAWLEFNVYPSETGLSIYFRDITERKEYQRKLEESNERLEQFAYAASHDLQEPLRMVSSYLQLLERRYADDLDTDAQEFIEFAVDGAERMSKMIEGLLKYSRIETQGDPFEPIELNTILEEVGNDLQFQIEESDAEITVESLPRIEGDPSQIRQVFQNLLGNAIEYSGDEPPSIHVAAEYIGSDWLISVRDEGIGIDPDEADRVFEVFQRLHSQDEHEGTGIGLALCQRVIERHGGEIWVESSPGEGSVFYFTIPATEEQ